jgi:hypothetical protein
MGTNEKPDDSRASVLSTKRLKAFTAAGTSAVTRWRRGSFTLLMCSAWENGNRDGMNRRKLTTHVQTGQSRISGDHTAGLLRRRVGCLFYETESVWVQLSITAVSQGLEPVSMIVDIHEDLQVRPELAMRVVVVTLDRGILSPCRVIGQTRA